MNCTLFKRSAALFICIILISASFLSTNAQISGKDYRVEELKMNVTLPQTMLAITRDSTKEDTYFATFAETYNDNMTYFNDADVYLMGKTLDKRLTIVLTMTQDNNSKDIYNYKFLSKDELKKIQDGYMSSGIYTSCTEDELGDMTFLDFIIDYKSDGNEVYGAYSNTVVNGMIVNFTFASANGKLTSDDYKTIQEILSSVKFDKIYDKSAINDSVYKIILFVILTIAAISAIAFIVFTIIKKKNSSKHKHEKLIQQLNHEHGFKPKPRPFTDENDNPDSYDNTNYDIDVEAINNAIELQQEEENNSYNSDVDEIEKPAENSSKAQAEQSKIEGYQSSADYFEQVFGDDFETTANLKAAAQEESFYGESVKVYDSTDAFEMPEYEDDSKKDSAIKALGASVSSFFIHFGYFCKNLKRALTKKKKKSRYNKNRNSEISSRNSSSVQNRTRTRNTAGTTTPSHRTQKRKSSAKDRNDDTYTSRRW